MSINKGRFVLCYERISTVHTGTIKEGEERGGGRRGEGGGNKSRENLSALLLSLPIKQPCTACCLQKL